MEQGESPLPKNQAVDVRRVVIFCLIAVVISGTAAFYIALQGGLEALSPVQALLILGLWYMPAPALAHLLTRVITREGWADLWLHPHFRQGWRMWPAAWFLPPLLVIAGGALYFLFFPQHFDPTFAPVRKILEQVAAA